MYKDTPEPWQLRSMLPDVALNMETQSLRMQVVDDLRLKASTMCGKRSAVIRVTLNDDHYLVIKPVDRGYEGCFEWFTYVQEADEAGAPFTRQSIRTSVALVKGSRKPDLTELLSFTTHCADIEETIRVSTRIIFTHTGQRFTPQTQSHGKNWKKTA